MRSVLIIDDSLTVRMDLQEAFQQAGWKATVSPGAAGARSALAEDRFHVVILDSWLADGKGTDFLKEIKSNRTTACTPVILLSAESEAVAADARDPGVRADARVEKPYDRLDLVLQAQLLADCQWEPLSRPSVPVILTVDDSKTYSHELASQLRKDNLDVILAESGEEALDLLQSQTFDCVLLDMVMPGVSGQEVCRRIKSLPHSRGTPVLMLTGREDRDAILESFEAGADDYVSKASDYFVLRARLRAQLHRRRVEMETNRVREEFHQKRTAELAEHARKLRALTGELARAEHRERRRIAKILHDHLQQLLFGAKLRVELLGRSDDEPIRQLAGEVKDLLDESVQVSRSLTADLSPPILQEGGLSAALEWLSGWMADRHGLHVDLVREADIATVDEDVNILLFDSVRELLFNAVKHARVDTVRVLVRQPSEGQVEITVSDDGPGFDPAKVSPVGQEGGGFGLFGMRERLGLIGGTMQVDSAPGKGSRFVLTAPLLQPEAASPSSTESMAAVEPGPQIGLAAPGTKIRVMVADDHAVVREALSQLLSRELDIEIVGGATDGQVAVDLAGRLVPDVILMDLSMPRLNGIEATRIIHNDFPDICIIGLSMFDEAERAQAMRDAGAVEYLTKSGPSTDLLGAIRACARTPKAGGNASASPED